MFDLETHFPPKKRLWVSSCNPLNIARILKGMVLSCSICLLSWGQEVTSSMWIKGDRNFRKFIFKCHMFLTTGKHYFRKVCFFLFLFCSGFLCLLKVEILNKLNLRQTSVKDYPDTLYSMQGQRSGLSFSEYYSSLYFYVSTSINPSISYFWRKQFRKWS